MDRVQVKQELKLPNHREAEPSNPIFLVDLSTSDSDSSSSSSSSEEGNVLGISGKRSRVSSGVVGVSSKKKKRKKELGVVLPPGFLDPLPPKNSALALALSAADSRPQSSAAVNVSDDVGSCKQFWKAGDYTGTSLGDWDTSSGGMDHVRVHPKFLHSNATSHKWVLGAFAELLDNALDEVCNGATFVNIDMLKNKKDGSRILLIEDNGGGMDPDKMRQCMSLGYSAKGKSADTIGQYGNGFKTSTMRLGADVIMFSRSCGKDGKRPTQSIGMLSYTFLRSTGKEDIVVPMLDYERGGQEWNKMKRSSVCDWNRNLEAMVQWSPFTSEVDLLKQFNQMKDHGTRIIIYNLWEDDEGLLELDFDADPHDIQIRGVNRDEKNIQMAKQYPNSKHFLTYRHSLRNYASILYLRIPSGFRIILRGKDVEHHNIVNDMMMSQEFTYRPHHATDVLRGDPSVMRSGYEMVAIVTIGFVKDATAHIDVQGFNVYHKNRLIKPFWRVWNAAGSDGRGVIGILEANFVEPAHDKQGFERTTVLQRLEARLVQMQKTYWSKNCHKIGYAPRRNNKHIDYEDTSPEYLPQTSSRSKKNTSSSGKIPTQGAQASERYLKTMDKIHGNGRVYSKGGNRSKIPAKYGKDPRSLQPPSPSEENASDDEMQTALVERRANENSRQRLPVKRSFGKDGSPIIGSSLNPRNTEGRASRMTTRSQAKGDDARKNECSTDLNSNAFDQLKEENEQLRERLKRMEEDILGDLRHELQIEKEKCKSLETKLEEATQKIEKLNKQHEDLVGSFSEERQRRDMEEESLRKKLKDASNTIQELLDKISSWKR